MLLLQISAGTGPVECQLACAKALHRLLQDAQGRGVGVDVEEQSPGVRLGTFRSVLLSLDGPGAEDLAGEWEGTLQWVCQSPYRQGATRKNWFIGVSVFPAPHESLEGGIRFETMRASGPGGQHVNTTESAVRAIHVATGISVKVQTSRSQHQNRKLAVLLVSRRLEQMTEEGRKDQRADRRMEHYKVERGMAGKVFRGSDFLPG